MPLPGSVKSASPGLHGLDANTVLTAANCRVFKQRGFSFVLRYVSRGETLPSGDLSAAEAATILSAGLALMPIQHVAPAGWTPSRALGQSTGQNAAKHVRTIGFPPGVNVWFDLEGVKSGASHA